MENKIYLNSLLDFYGKLLTEKQQEICNYYYAEDFSLNEIAEIENISRSAVYDTVRRCRKELDAYEDKLHLYAHYKKRMTLYEEMKKHCSSEMNVLIDQCIDTEIE